MKKMSVFAILLALSFFAALFFAGWTSGSFYEVHFFRTPEIPGDYILFPVAYGVLYGPVIYVCYLAAKRIVASFHR